MVPAANQHSHCKLTAPSTIAILGMPLSKKHDSYRNKRALQDGVRAQNGKEAPAGLQWNGTLFILILLFSILTVTHHWWQA
jgi:hypothetical protein